MRPWRAARRGTTVLAPIALCVLSVVCAGALSCALLVPKSWRVGTPVPLAGPIHANDAKTDDWSEISTKDLATQVDADHRRLMEIAATTEGEDTAERRLEEAREIAERLPALQEELRSRGGDASGPRPHHPTIR
jgi:hypothetical protein